MVTTSGGRPMALVGRPDKLEPTEDLLEPNNNFKKNLAKRNSIKSE